jgi:outer membrane cobalamin receptor
MRALHYSLAMLLMGVVVGCGPSQRSKPPLTPDGSLIYTSDDIALMQVSTAWDVVARSGEMNMSVSTDGHTATIRNRRGHSSILFPEADMPLLIVDGVRIDNAIMLRHIAAPIIQELSITDGMHSTIKEGTGSSGGVIAIVTKSGGE